MNFPYISMRGMPDWTDDLEIVRKKMDCYVQYKHPNEPRLPVLGKYMTQQYVMPSQDVTGYAFGLRPDLIMSIIWAANGLFNSPDSYRDYNPLGIKCGLNRLEPANWADGILLLCARIESFFLPKDGPKHGNGGYDPCYKSGHDYSYIIKMGRIPDDLYGVCARLLGHRSINRQVEVFVEKVLFYANEIRYTPVTTPPVDPPDIEPPTIKPPNPPTANGEGFDNVKDIIQQYWIFAVAGLGLYMALRPKQK